MQFFSFAFLFLQLEKPAQVKSSLVSNHQIHLFVRMCQAKYFGHKQGLECTPVRHAGFGALSPSKQNSNAPKLKHATLYPPIENFLATVLLEC